MQGNKLDDSTAVCKTFSLILRFASCSGIFQHPSLWRCEHSTYRLPSSSQWYLTARRSFYIILSIRESGEFWLLDNILFNLIRRHKYYNSHACRYHYPAKSVIRFDFCVCVFGRDGSHYFSLTYSWRLSSEVKINLNLISRNSGTKSKSNDLDIKTKFISWPRCARTYIFFPAHNRSFHTCHGFHNDCH